MRPRTRQLFIALILCTLLPATPTTAAVLGLTSAHLTTASKAYGAVMSCTLEAVADTYVNKLVPNTNFGTATTVQVSPDSLATQRTFVRFDLSGCTPAIPVDALVQSANVQLTLTSAALATRTLELRVVTSGWAEGMATWNVQPAQAVSASSTAAVTLGSAAGTNIQWNASADVQAIIGGSPDFGWRVADTAEGILAGATVSFGSREAATGRPLLVISYRP